MIGTNCEVETILVYGIHLQDMIPQVSSCTAFRTVLKARHLINVVILINLCFKRIVAVVVSLVVDYIHRNHDLCHHLNI